MRLDGVGEAVFGVGDERLGLLGLVALLGSQDQTVRGRSRSRDFSTLPKLVCLPVSAHGQYGDQSGLRS